MNVVHAELLRGKGLSVTAQRLAVLQAVWDSPHCTADNVAEHARAQIGTISRQAVYDSLAVLTETNLVRKIHPAGSPALFDPRTGDNHHHIICRTCSKVVDVDCAVGQAPCLSAAVGSGFEVDEAEVVFWGKCPNCRANTAD
ncbi:MAG: Fe2+ or Zn2+ uptake regulation protein [Neolewinella sp.]|jgi:Fur family ferric uptake transcriptional regulator